MGPLLLLFASAVAGSQGGFLHSPASESTGRAQDEGRGAARGAGGSPPPAGGGGGSPPPAGGGGHDPADGSGGHPADGGGGRPGDGGGGTSGGGGDNISFLAGLPGDLVGGFLGSRSALEFRAAAKAFDTPLYEALLCELSSYNTSSGDLVRALRMLARTAEKGDSRAIAAVSGRPLTDKDPDVRGQAVLVLEEIASKGSREAIAAMLGRLIEDEDDDVRGTAVRSLARIAEKGDAQVIAALRGLLRQAAVWQEAVRALVTIAPNDVIGEVIAVISDQSRADGSVHAVSVLEQFAKELAAATPNVAFHKDNHKVVLQAICRVAADEQDPSVRTAAVRALGRAAEKGDAQVIAAVLGHLADRHFTVRQEAARALATIAPTNGDVFAAISDQSRADPHAYVRLVAVSVLPQFASHNRKAVLQAIGRVLAADENLSVRLGAVKALGRVAEKDDAEVIAVLRGRLADGDSTVRQEAARALATIAPTNGDVFAAISDLCQTDPHGSVRLVAVRVLPQFASHNRKAVLQAIRRVAADRGGPFAWTIRMGAVEALAEIAAAAAAEEEGGSRSEVISAILDVLADEHDGVREQAVRALVEIGTAEEKVIAAIADLLADHHQPAGLELVVVAVRALAELAEKGNGKSIAALLGRIAVVHYEEEEESYSTHEDLHGSRGVTTVRVEAMRALAKIAEKGDAQVIVALRDQLVADGHFTVRQEALRALVTMTENDEEVIAAISDQSRADQHGSVRMDLVSVLEQFAQELAAATPNTASRKHNRKVVLQAICRVAADEQDPSVRTEAVGALGRAAEKGDAQVIAAVLGHLADRHFTVRQEAVRALATIAPNNGDVIAAISDLCQKDPDESVRLVAVEVLPQFAPHSREVVLQAFRRVAEDRDQTVRWVAVLRALGRVAEKDDAGEIAVIRRCLEDHSSSEEEGDHSSSEEEGRVAEEEGHNPAPVPGKGGGKGMNKGRGSGKGKGITSPSGSRAAKGGGKRPPLPPGGFP